MIWIPRDYLQPGVHGPLRWRALADQDVLLSSSAILVRPSIVRDLIVVTPALVRAVCAMPRPEPDKRRRVQADFWPVDPHAARPDREKPQSLGIADLTEQERVYGLGLERNPVRSLVVPDRIDCGPRPCPWCRSLVAMTVTVGEVNAENHRPDGQAVRKTGSAPEGGLVQISKQPLRERSALDVPMRLRDPEGDSGRRATGRQIHDVRMLSHEARYVRDAGIQGVVLDETEVRESEVWELPPVRRSRDQGLPGVESELRSVLRGDGEEAEFGAQSRSQGERRQLRAGQLPMGHEEPATEEQAHLSCPKCRRRVRYARGVGGSDWTWQRHHPGEDPPRLEPGEGDGYYRALNHCRPCGHASCPQNNYLSRTASGAAKLTWPNREPWEVPPSLSCADDISEKGPATVATVAKALNLTEERIRQLQVSGQRKLKGSWLGQEVARHRREGG